MTDKPAVDVEKLISDADDRVHRTIAGTGLIAGLGIGLFLGFVIGGTINDRVGFSKAMLLGGVGLFWFTAIYLLYAGARFLLAKAEKVREEHR